MSDTVWHKPVTIIAEAGVNHNGCVETACRMIDVAADCGADAVKFQTFEPERLVSRFAPKAAYQRRRTAADESQLQMIERLRLPAEDHRRLLAGCRRRGVAFMSSAFDLESIDLLVELGLETFKVPSGEITNDPYLRKIGALGRRVILSTGMADMEEIGRALEILTTAGTNRDDITVLQCNTGYPTPMRDVNLRAMQTIREVFSVTVGYSDHTEGMEAAIAAVAMGATVIEKHFTLDSTMAGPDHIASAEPGQFRALVAAVRNTELAMGDGIKRPSPSERQNRAVARKSVVAAVDIPAGSVITPEMLAVKRPGTGVPPGDLETLVGSRARRSIERDEVITWQAVERGVLV